MSRKDQRIESLFRNLAPPDLPPELRTQVLNPALEALQQAPAPDIWSRIWSSRPLRLAWSASFSVLVLCHLGLTLTRISPNHAQQAGHLPTRSNASEEELAEVLYLQRLRTDVQPLAGRLMVQINESSDDTSNRPVSDDAESGIEENPA